MLDLCCCASETCIVDSNKVWHITEIEMLPPRVWKFVLDLWYWPVEVELHPNLHPISLCSNKQHELFCAQFRIALPISHGGQQAQPIDPNLTAKLLGRGVAVSPIVTVEPRRRKFHKAITLSMPAPKAHSQGMINQYSGNAPTLRLLCSITGTLTVLCERVRFEFERVCVCVRLISVRL